MRVLRGCKMISSGNLYGNQGLVLLGLLLLICMPPVRATDYWSLDGRTASELAVGDRLVSSPNGFFELGIFPFNYSGYTGDTSSGYFLCIRFASPIESAVTWVANRDIPLTSAAVLLYSNGSLNLFDPNHDTQRNNLWSTQTANMNVVSASLLDSGKLVLSNANETVWNSFDDSPPTDTLLPGQRINRSGGHRLVSWQRNGNPGNANDTYSFGWDDRGVLTLSWTCPKAFLNWRGGHYIPAPDAYAAHTIQNVDSVYFHETLGHLYVGSDPPTAILSGGPDGVNGTTLKRITVFPDGGLRIMQFTINQTLNQSSNERWTVAANWAVSERPDSRSQCATFGTCGPFSECVSAIDSLDAVRCRCPGADDPITKGWFVPAYGSDPTRGCLPKNPQADCSNTNGTYFGMLELPGVDAPWGGDYKNFTTNNSAACREACAADCYCAGATFSVAEQMCWGKSSVLFNLGWPTVALHGTDRITFLRNQTVPELPMPPQPSKDNLKLVKILAPAVGIPILIVVACVMIFCIWSKDCLQSCGRCWSCCRTPKASVEGPGYPAYGAQPSG